MGAPPPSRPRGRALGRYVLYDAIASGGMASVHYARLVGDGGFSRTVAIKRLHGHLATDAQFAAMFQDEARLAARIRHPNVVPTLDVVGVENELFLVMEYVDGESLWNLLRTLAREKRHVPLRVASAIVTGLLHGLHAAHEAKSEGGEPLHLVHRDVSPQNVIVGSDGVPRVLDFGIAKAIGRIQTTADGQVKGKASYMAPEQLKGGAVDARTDVYAAAVVAWEVLACERLFSGTSPEATMNAVLERAVPPPSSRNPDVPPELDAIVLRGLARDPAARFATAREMAIAVESIVPPASAREVGDFMKSIAGAVLEERARVVAAIESDSNAPGFETSPVTEATATTTVVETSKRSRKALVAASLAVAAGFTAAWLGLGHRSVDAPRSAAPAGSTPLPEASSAVAARAPDPPETPPLPAASVAPPAPSVSPAAPPAAHKAPAHRAKRDCREKFYFDANGIKVPKPECI